MNQDDTLAKLADTAFFCELRQTIAEWQSRMNQHELADLLITKCIDYGIDTRRRIFGALVQLDFKWNHVAIRLDLGTGDDEGVHRWKRHADETYSNIVSSAAGIAVPTIKSDAEVAPAPRISAKDVCIRRDLPTDE